MDNMALNFLLYEDSGIAPARITVYFAAGQIQYREMAALKERVERVGAGIVVEGWTTGERDAAMTRDSDYDILRYMSVEEQKDFHGARYFPRVSNTEKNERRRLGLPLHVNYALVDRADEPRPEHGGGAHGQSGAFSAWRKGVSDMVDRIRSTGR